MKKTYLNMWATFSELPSYISTMLLNTNEGARGEGRVNSKMRGGGWKGQFDIMYMSWFLYNMVHLNIIHTCGVWNIFVYITKLNWIIIFPIYMLSLFELPSHLSTMVYVLFKVKVILYIYIYIYIYMYINQQTVKQ